MRLALALLTVLAGLAAASHPVPVGWVSGGIAEPGGVIQGGPGPPCTSSSHPAVMWLRLLPGSSVHDYLVLRIYPHWGGMLVGEATLGKPASVHFLDSNCHTFEVASGYVHFKAPFAIGQNFA